MKTKATLMALSGKVQDKELIVLDKIALTAPKTKEMAKIIKKLPLKDSSRLVLYSDGNNRVFLAARNIKKTGVLEARNLNVVDLLNYKYLLTSKEGIKEIESTFYSKK